MWISKHKWEALEKKVADLEEKTKDQSVEKISDGSPRFAVIGK